MRNHFEDYMEHPLLDSVNFPKEKWQEYLSYRTDSYAYELTENYELKRKNDFHSFEIQTFDRFKFLTEGFARKTNFKEFFNQKRSTYTEIIKNYQKEYLLNEMKNFLSEEFGDYFKDVKYSVVISPFVYAQNLHRDIDSTWTADFPSTAKQIIEGKEFDKVEDKSTEIHTLLTEMDHGYVNPVSEKYNISSKFNEKYWDNESGYAGNGKDVFNEYMTWAIYDIFNKRQFPEIANKINLNWHFQNDSRGFQYSNLFGTKLMELYTKEPNTKIKDLYPKILDWTFLVQNELTKPIITNKTDTIIVHSHINKIVVNFSEKMNKTNEFDVVLYFDQWNSEIKTITTKHNITWSNDGKSMTFDLSLPNKEQYHLLFNWWGVSHPIKSQKNILLKAANGFIVKGNSSDSNR